MKTTFPAATDPLRDPTINRTDDRTRHRGNLGFTLIELLVVVIILGVLAAIAVPVYTAQKDKAARASTRSNFRNLVPVVMSARENNKQTLTAITGSTCSACACGTATHAPVKDPAFAATTCGANWQNFVNTLAAASGESPASMRALLTDGYGYAITIDENEGEAVAWGVCGVGADRLISFGPDHAMNSSDDVTQHLPVGGCSF